MHSVERSSIPPLGAVFDFMRLLWAVDHALQRASKRMARTSGVTGPQRLVVRIAGRFPGITAGHLAEFLHLHPSTLTGILDRLRRKGLITRRPDPRDGRRALLGLTTKGRRLDVEAEGTLEATVRRFLASLPEPEVLDAAAVLRGLAASFESNVRDVAGDRAR